ncbi:MAG: hypothetical protein HRT88_06080, partial [Lentisphaeraceae bacterium]|nr:hypothetical protein [Lentisphaeraceae bacterium]
MAHGNHYDKESVQAPGGKWNGLWIVLGALGAGLIYGGFQVASDNDHSFHSYLTSFMFYLSIALGGLFFVMLQHLTRAGWSVTIRRMAEAFMKNVVLMLILFVPILMNVNTIFAWADTRTAAEMGVSHGDHADAHAVKADAHAGHDHAAGDKHEHSGGHAEGPAVGR